MAQVSRDCVRGNWLWGAVVCEPLRCHPLRCQWCALRIALWFSAALSIVLHYLLVSKYSYWSPFQYFSIPFQTFLNTSFTHCHIINMQQPFETSKKKERKKENNKNNRCPLLGGVRLVCWKLWCSRMSGSWIDLAKNTCTPDQSEAPMCCGPAGPRALQASKSSF